MNFGYLALAVMVACVATMLFGCTSNRPYRTDMASCDTAKPDADCAKAVIETTPDYKLGFVEFDDQGWFWHREPLKKVEEMIQGEIATDRGVIMVLFVHGWKNNAAYNNGNVQMFRAALKGLSDAEQTKYGDHARKVVGVYAGWRGLSVKSDYFPPLGKELTFWSRKRTAHKVGNGAMTELLVSLEDIQRAANASVLAGAPRSDFIIIGHSFGAAAVYSALCQVVTERFVETVEQNQPLKPLGDQIILLNPAFEASRHYNLNQLAVSISKYPDAQRPVLSIFTSKGDWATHYAFPLGRFFSSILQSFRRDEPQRSADVHAIGWFQRFITHDLVYDATSKIAANSTLNLQTKKHELRQLPQKLQRSIANVHEQRQKWHPNAPRPTEYSFDDCSLKPKKTFRPGDPFLIVSVDKKIMKDHNDIGNPVLINFLREYIEFCQK
jgi:alpha-beta hydrolase superfamily lysophospholipase